MSYVLSMVNVLVSRLEYFLFTHIHLKSSNQSSRNIQIYFIISSMCTHKRDVAIGCVRSPLTVDVNKLVLAVYFLSKLNTLNTASVLLEQYYRFFRVASVDERLSAGII